MATGNNHAADDLASIRNLGIIAHIDAGKTTLTERLLYYSGRNHRLGEVDGGNTVMDYLDEERARGITIVAAAASLPWRNPDGEGERLLHLIDTPGHIDFTAEVERALRVIDGAVVIFSGVEGVEAQSEKVWHQSDRYRVPKIAFINKLDRIGASFGRVLGEIRAKFADVAVVALQQPAGVESALAGTIDLIAMRMLRFIGDDGAKVESGPIPDEHAAAAALGREALLAALADLSDPIAELYLAEATVPTDLLHRELRRLTMANRLVPVLCGSAKRNLGVQPVLDAVVRYLPSPADRNRYPALHGKTDEPVELDVADPNFAGLVFKIIAGDSADLLYLRTYTGRLRVGDTLLNVRTGGRVRVKRLLRLYAKNVESVEDVGPGDIVGVIGPADTTTGDTLCAVNHPVRFEKIAFPEPVISIAVEPKSTRDRDRLDACLALLCREDPTLHLSRNEATGQQLLSGMGELHLEIKGHRIRDEFKVEARFGVPQVAFRETLRTPCTVTGIFRKTIAEQELFAEVDVELTPVPRLATGIEVGLRLKNRNQLPATWLAAAEQTLANGLRTGGNLGYPLIYIRAAVTRLVGDADHTTESAIVGAVLNALGEAIRRGTAILEPLVRVDIHSPENTIGEITGYLQARRAVIHGIAILPNVRHLTAEVPLAEMFGFSKALPKLSGGRAACSMEPCGYQEISPADLQRLADRQAQRLM
jgi:elongation factor G